MFQNFSGTLNGTGQATAQLVLPDIGPIPGPITVYFAFVTNDVARCSRRRRSRSRSRRSVPLTACDAGPPGFAGPRRGRTAVGLPIAQQSWRAPALHRRSDLDHRGRLALRLSATGSSGGGAPGSSQGVPAVALEPERRRVRPGSDVDRGLQAPLLVRNLVPLEPPVSRSAGSRLRPRIASPGGS